MKKTLAIRSTVTPQEKLSFNDWALNIKKQLVTGMVKDQETKPNRFYLNKFKSDNNIVTNS